MKPEHHLRPWQRILVALVCVSAVASLALPALAIFLWSDEALLIVVAILVLPVVLSSAGTWLFLPPPQRSLGKEAVQRLRKLYFLLLLGFPVGFAGLMLVDAPRASFGALGLFMAGAVIGSLRYLILRPSG
ncbi:MAG: hypothetical protein U1B78_01490 [Dehalococcoidia bacterium]|nr:hypothetical protein [Dehalococcoidia bacterium]